MSFTLPTRPDLPVDEEIRLIIEQRLSTADDEPCQEAREAIEEIRSRRKLEHQSAR